MDSKRMKSILTERLQRDEWNITFDQKNDKLRIEDRHTNQGITISLPGIISKWEERKQKAIDDVVYHVEEALNVMTKSQNLKGKESKIFPVIRSTSFPKETKEGIPLIYEEHTAETRVYYALDLGKTYRLIDENMAKDESWDIEKIKEVARFNVRSLDTSMKSDEVAGNTFYFLNHNDGYDASRILNESLLEKMDEEIEGTLAVAVPHQDVLIFADIKNDQGYDVLAQLTMNFFTEGRVPITSLPFLYENHELEPIFILAKNKPKNDKN